VEHHLQAFKEIRTTQLYNQELHEYRLNTVFNRMTMWPQRAAVRERKTLPIDNEDRPETFTDMVVRPASSKISLLHVTIITVGSVTILVV